MELSRRLRSVADGVSPGNRVADIGTDHGYIPIFLVQKGIVPFAIAMDVKKGPLFRARDHIREQGLEDRIETRLSDGLEKLKKDEADTIVIAGMGGALMSDILERGLPVLSDGKELVLQPQSEIFKVRHWLHDHRYQIVREEIIKEEDKFYFVIVAEPGSQRFSEEFLYQYGEYLLKEKTPWMKEYLEKESIKYKKILEKLEKEDSLLVNKRKEELKQQISLIEKAYQYGM